MSKKKNLKENTDAYKEESAEKNEANESPLELTEEEKKKKAKEEKKAAKKAEKIRRKKLMKFGLAVKIIYILFILAVIGAGAYAVKFVWDECAVYQQSSATVRVGEAIDTLKELTGLELKTNLIPSKTEGDKIFYKLYNEDNHPVAEVELAKIRNILKLVAIYEEPKIRSLMSYDIMIPSDAEVSLREGESILDSELVISDADADHSKKFTLSAKGTLSNMGISVPTYKWVRIGGIFTIDQASCMLGEKELAIKEMDGKYFYAPDNADPDLNTGLRQRAAYIAEKYSNYISGDYPYWSLYNMILWNSPLPARLNNVTLTWYGAHTGVEIEDMKVSDAFKLTSSDYLLNVDFYYISYGYVDTVKEHVKMCMVLHNEGGTWKIAELLNHIEQDWIAPYPVG